MAKDLTFEANDRTIKDVLFGGAKFRVPPYQREYSWKKDQVEELWQDIKQESETFFLGSLVFNLEYLKKEDFIDVIDGQQRLLTLTMLLAALRVVAEAEGLGDFAGRIQRQTIGIETNRGIKTYRLEPADSLRDFFHRRIQKFPSEDLSATSDEEKLVLKNYNELKNYILTDLDSIEGEESVEEYLQAIWDRVEELQVIWIQISSEEDAYTIFETVNARGAELTVADLLKNIIFKNVDSKNLNQAKIKWQTIKDNTSGNGIDISKFVRHYWISREKMVGEKLLFKRIKEKVKDYNQFLDDLVEASNWYALFIAGPREEWQKKEEFNHQQLRRLYKSIQGFRAMNTSQVYSLLLSLMRHSNVLGMDVSKFVRQLENFSFKYSTITQGQANRVEKLYSRYANFIENVALSDEIREKEEETKKLLEELLSELGKELPSEEEFCRYFMELKLKQSEPGRALFKYILSRLNDSIGTGELELNFSEVTLEHILPQHPDPEWDLKESQIKDYVDLLGNLTLIHYKMNSQLGNETPAKKAIVLSKSEIAMTANLGKDFKRSPTWNKKTIEKRQKDLAELAYRNSWA